MRLTRDFAAGPLVATQGASLRTDEARVTVREEMDGEPSMREQTVTESGAEPRVFLGSRLSFAPGATFQGFVAFDGDFTLVKNSDGPTGVIELPDWTLGLSVGSTVGTP